jgi:hypothetical protein
MAEMDMLPVSIISFEVSSILDKLPSFWRQAMKKINYLIAFFSMSFLSLFASFPEKATAPILGEKILTNIAHEVSGSICFEHVQYLSTLHRIWGSRDYHQAAKYLIDKSLEYGLSEGKIEQFPIKTGREHFWLHSTGGYVPWDLKQGELRLVSPFPMLISDYESAPSTVAVCSRSTDTQAEVVFVGKGDSVEDYKGKEVKGKIVLAEGGRPEKVHEFAVHHFGALGTIQYYISQGNYLEAEGIYWGRILPWSQDGKKESTFGFNISTTQGIFLKNVLEKKEKVIVSASIKAEIVQNGVFELATATIPGSIYPEEEFILYAHLDHPKPGAHDNASGDAVLLEIARTLSTLAKKKIIPYPERTIRFLWIPHMSGLNMYLLSHPEKIGKIKGGCNVDCVGVNQAKFPSKFHLALPPHSIDSLLTLIAQNLANHLNQKITNGINEGTDEGLLFSPEGTRNLFSVTLMPYQGASDEYTANTRSLNIPSIYFYDDPIPPRHNQINFLNYIDQTNLKRIAYLGAIISYAFATAGEETAPFLLNELTYQGKNRIEADLLKAKNKIEASTQENIYRNYEADRNLLYWGIKRERRILSSLSEIVPERKYLKSLFSECSQLLEENASSCLRQLESYYKKKCQSLHINPLNRDPDSFDPSWEKIVPVENPNIKGSPGYFSNYFEDLLGEDFLTRYKGVRPSFKYGNVGYYETLNFIDGRNTVPEIYKAIQSELWSEDYSPYHSLSFEEMVSYISLLKDAKVIDFSYQKTKK